MIRLDALLLLLFLEFMVLCAVLVVFLFFRNRKYKLLYRNTLREVTSLKRSSTAPATKKLAGHQNADIVGSAAMEKTFSNAKYAEVLKEKDFLAAKAAELETRLEEQNRSLDDLQKKHATLEKEYSVLYGKHFDGKENCSPA